MNAPVTEILWAIAGLLAALTGGTAVRLFALRNSEPELRRKRLASLRTWWILALLVSAALLLGKPGIGLLLATASCIGWQEITRLYLPRHEDRHAIRAGYGLILIHYALVVLGLDTLYPVFLPVAAPLTIAFLLLITDQPKGYVRAAGGFLWGIMFVGYGVSHAALLLNLPQTQTGPLGPLGWFLFLVILTECDDIFQAIVGRRFGAHKRHCIAPVISPNKTLEGFIGGMLVIVILAPLTAPLLTGLGSLSAPSFIPAGLHPMLTPVLAALLISFAGYFGDINMSAVKRDAGVKDSSNLLPGMGGIIDRIDSLTMTAPVFYYFVMGWLG
ncbi:MAG: Phosphatidate cytidylyltransferase [Pseudomonadota bacterium]|jgi:phosphatidate cytidylyltransferase